MMRGDLADLPPPPSSMGRKESKERGRERERDAGNR